MLSNWRNWCRLCANTEALFKIDSRSDMLQTVQKYFMLTISSYDNVCCDCYDFVVKLNKFAEKCSRSDKMYSELLMDTLNLLDNDLPNLRFRYGFEEDVKLTDSMQDDVLPRNMFEISYLKVDQSTDTYDLQELKFDDKIPKSKKKEAYKILRNRRGRPKRNTKKKIVMESSDYEESVELKKGFEDFEKVMVEDNCQIKTEIVVEDITVPVIEKPEISEPEEDTNDDEYQVELDGMVEVNVDSEDDEKPLLVKFSKRRRNRIQTNEDFADKKDDNVETKLLKCQLCRKKYKCRSYYEQHMLTKHIEPGELSYTCSKCNKTFSTIKKLKIHEIVHLPNSQKLVHPCTHCDKKFTKQVNVQAHIRAIHIGDRPFICEECGKSFGTKGALKEHQITHSEERPFQCSYCPKKFKNLPRLKTHEDIHNDTTYVCPHCGLQLNTKRTLKMHMVVHSDQKKYKCQYCGNEYKRSKALKNHLILHTGLRPYSCPFCDKTFANGSNCRSHKKKAHPLELAQLEASGQPTRVTNIPKLEHLQPKPQQLQQIAANNEMTTTTIIQQQQTIHTHTEELHINTPNMMQDMLHQLPNPVITTLEQQITSSTSILTNLHIPINEIQIPEHTITTVPLIQSHDM